MGLALLRAEGQGEAALDDGREALEEGGGAGDGLLSGRVDGLDGVGEGVAGDRVVALGALLVLAGKASLLFTSTELVGLPGEPGRGRWLVEHGDLLEELGLELDERLAAGVEGKVKDRVDGLPARVVVRRQVGVAEGLVDGDPRRRVEIQHPVQQVDPGGGDVGEAVGEGLPGVVREALDVGPGAAALDAGEGLGGGRAQLLQDQVELLEGGLPGQEDLAPEQLGEDAAHRPDVEALAVLRPVQEDLGRPVPPGGHVVRHRHVRAVHGLAHPPRQPEVADLQLAVVPPQDVPRLQVPVDDVGRMEGFQPAEQLVEEVPDVGLGEGELAVDNVHQVGVHQLLRNVQLVKVGLGALEDVLDGDDLSSKCTTP